MKDNMFQNCASFVRGMIDVAQRNRYDSEDLSRYLVNCVQEGASRLDDYADIFGEGAGEYSISELQRHQMKIGRKTLARYRARKKVCNALDRDVRLFNVRIPSTITLPMDKEYAPPVVIDCDGLMLPVCGYDFAGDILDLVAKHDNANLGPFYDVAMRLLGFAHTVLILFMISRNAAVVKDACDELRKKIEAEIDKCSEGYFRYLRS